MRGGGVSGGVRGVRRRGQGSKGRPQVRGGGVRERGRGHLSHLQLLHLLAGGSPLLHQGSLESLPGAVSLGLHGNKP